MKGFITLNACAAGPTRFRIEQIARYSWGGSYRGAPISEVELDNGTITSVYESPCTIDAEIKKAQDHDRDH